MMVPLGYLAMSLEHKRSTSDDCACINCDMSYMNCMMIQD